MSNAIHVNYIINVNNDIFNRHVWQWNQSQMLFNTSLAAKGALANRMQRRTACKIQNGRQGAPKWQRGSGKVSTPRFLGVLSNFR